MVTKTYHRHSETRRRACVTDSGYNVMLGSRATTPLGSFTSFSEELADRSTSRASKNSDSDSEMDALLSLDTWWTRGWDSSVESCFWIYIQKAKALLHLYVCMYMYMNMYRRL